ncbi:Sensor histidine kinase RcsC [subsurface metagenome]
MIKRLSLSGKITFYIGISLFLFLFVILYWNYWQVRLDTYDYMEARAIALADEINFAFEALAKYEEEFSLQRVVEQTATIGDVAEVGITNREGRYFAHNQQELIGEKIEHPLHVHVIESERRQISYTRNKFIVIQPLHGKEYLTEHRSDVIGAIIVTIDLSLVNANLHREFLTQSLATIIFIMLFCVSVMIIMNRLIIRPIKALSVASKRLADGNWEVEVPKSARDEISELSCSFGQMACVLEERKKILQMQKEELQKAHDELEQRVEDRTAKLKKANEQLEREIKERTQAEEEKKELEGQLLRSQKMEAVGILAGGVAHDLNNILSGLVSIPDLLLLQLEKKSPLRKLVEIMKDSGEKAGAVVEDMLTLARRGVVVTEIVNLNNIISEYLKSPEYEKLQSFHPGVQVTTDCEQGLLNISCSAVHLSKTVMNLVSNAAEAMPEGGTVIIKTENRYIDRPISGYDSIEEGDYVILIVVDTGVGISAEDREKIFEPFYTKKVMGRSGTGLGMAVVWGTVKDHRGYIDVQSTEGEGATFTLYYPATREQIIKEKVLVPVQEYRGSGESVLVVDDVREQREIACTLLTVLGYKADAVTSGEEAVEYVKEQRVDLIVLDMIMDPGIDGLETYRKILEIHPGQRAIIASGYSETERVREAQRLGAGQYIKKPYTLEKIGLAVKTEQKR